MMCTPGVTAKKFSREPLMTEGEATHGADHLNPFEDADAREEALRVRQKERDREDSQLFKTGTNDGSDTGGVDHPLHANSVVDDPADDPDPFAFDDVSMGGFQLPGFR